MDDNDAAVQAYYALGAEPDRLSEGLGRVEFVRTTAILERTLPAPPAHVADIGGGPGRYTDWLVDLGHVVHHRDVVFDHVEQVRHRHPDLDARVGDARDIDLSNASCDAVLLLGPLYHLPQRTDRLAALRESRRVVRPGGVVYAAAISRWASRIHGVMVTRAHELVPEILDRLDEMEQTGWMPPFFEGSFTGYSHRPEDLRREIVEAGLTVESLVSVEGPSIGFVDLDERMNDERERGLLLDMLGAVEAIPELLGLGPHLLATARAE